MGNGMKDLLWKLKSEELEKVIEAEGRKTCPKCKRASKIFCFECQICILPKEIVPAVKLPVQIEIFQHPQENPSKGSAIHAVSLSPDVHLWGMEGRGKHAGKWPLPPSFDPNETVVLFPTADAEDVSAQDWHAIKRVIVVDASWQKAQAVVMKGETGVARYRKIKLQDEKGFYWRIQDHGADCVSTLEAIYHLVRQIHLAKEKTYEGQYDNLLVFFARTFRTVQQSYVERPSKIFRGKDNYIDYERAVGDGNINNNSNSKEEGGEENKQASS